MLVVSPPLESSGQPALSAATGPQAGKIGVVIPCYRSEKSIPEVVERLAATLSALNRAWEIVLIDDHSPDGTWRAVTALKAAYPDNLKAARTFKNVGQHNAIVCGFSLVEADIVVTMDDDLQNRPEDVPRLVAAVDEGVDVAIASYGNKRHAAWRNVSGRTIDSILRWLFQLPHEFELTSFRAIDGGVIKRIEAGPVPYPYVTAMVLANGTTAINVPVQHQQRRYGSSNYNLKRSMSLALNLLLNYSPLPVYTVMIMSILALLSSVGLGAWVVVKAMTANTPPGWASAMAATVFVGSQVMVVLLVVLVYLSRINQVLCGPPASHAIGERLD